MYRIALVEDDDRDAGRITDLLEKYKTEENSSFNYEIIRFNNAIVFLTNYKANYDIVFMDIEMPHMNGMEAARKLRELDSSTMLIFITNVAKMAQHGYEVEAFDFLVKPVEYDIILFKMRRILERLEKNESYKLLIRVDGAQVCLESNEILYIEVINHNLIYHTEKGNFESRGTIGKIRDELELYGFYMCNNCYLVNLKHVKWVKSFVVKVGDDELQVSHPRKKAFLAALNEYIGN